MGIIDKNLYSEIKRILELARCKAYSAVNFAMVEAYWNIGKSIVEMQGNFERAEYGTGFLIELSKQLTTDFGKGFEESNLRRMRQFYIAFQNRDALRHELSWTHFRLLIKVENEKARQFYLDECAKANWSTRQLERQINSFFYARILSSKEQEPVKALIITLLYMPDAYIITELMGIIKNLLGNYLIGDLLFLIGFYGSDLPTGKLMWSVLMMFTRYVSQNSELMIKFKSRDNCEIRPDGGKYYIKLSDFRMKLKA